MNVSLTNEQEKYVRKKVTSGQYASASEVVREGLRLLQEQETLRQLRIRQLRKEIEKGMADAEAGRLVDGPAALEAIVSNLRRQRTKKKRP